MRARFFAQNLRRFVNSDVIIGSISNAITLNRYAYANGNPVSNVDPFGLCVREDGEEKTELVDTIATFVDLYVRAKLFGYYAQKTVEKAVSPINVFWNSITSGVRGFVEKTSAWSQSANAWFEKTKNKDNEVALIDNNRWGEVSRLIRKNGWGFHEQYFVLEDSPEFFNLEEETFSLISLDFTSLKGAWVTENAELALLDFVNISIDLEFNPSKREMIDFALDIAIWNPSVTFNAFGKDITVELYVGGTAIPSWGINEEALNLGLGFLGLTVER